MDNKKIIESLNDKIKFEPIDNRILVKPLKEATLKKTITEPDPEANKNRDLTKEEAILKESVKTVPANHQKGVVLRIGKGITDVPFEVGDTVVFPIKAGVSFELFKNSKLLQRYEVVGVWR